MPIAYVKHPISKEEVTKIRSQGFKVIDVRFKPEKLEDGDKDFTEKPKRKPRAKKSDEKDV
ncbi:hypothetical protein NVP1132O_07 [Vibrio phage 1.132.O._10N.222.49.F8]|nr:hypothetical protein NVP1132O_07 [Vibrio phage 1.132.O._10N.222.49.F8]AUR91904.1 hypothetical protein NVP1167O_08 [Vibrio phage 1.167.O._10N.261.51.F2]